MIATLVGILFGRRAEARLDERAAERRWRRRNAELRTAGCRCGQPATHVRYVQGTTGNVPAEIWTCAEHVNVNGWTSDGPDGPWIPIPGATFDSMGDWVSPAFPADGAR